MTDNEIMTIEKAMFILRHGSAEGEHKYFEAVDVIEKEYNRQQEQIKKLENIEHFATKTIEKQEKEIEKLNVELVGMRGACESYKMHYDKAQAEIERLQKNLDDKCDKCIARDRAEAIKEFAERLKKCRVIQTANLVGYIDHLVKEMTEVSK